MIWIILFGLFFIAAGIGFIYLSSRFYKFRLIGKFSKENKKLRIIQFADSHVGTTFSGNDFSKHVKDMQAQNPDIVVITGDFIDDNTSKEDMLAACKALRNFDTAYGIYFAFGNHDKGYFHDPGKGCSHSKPAASQNMWSFI